MAKTEGDNGGAAKKKGGGKKGNGVKQGERFVKDDGRTLTVMLTEARGQFNTRATLKTPTGEFDGEGEDRVEIFKSQVIGANQTPDKAEAEANYQSLINEAKAKGWKSRKAGVIQSDLEEIPE